MRKLFDLTTLLLIIGLATLAYVGYHNFYLEGKEAEEQKKEEALQRGDRKPRVVEINESVTGERGEDVFSPENGSMALTEDNIVEREDVKIAKKDENKEDIKEPIIVSSKSEKKTPEEETETKKKEPNLPPIEEERSPKDPYIPEDKLTQEETPSEEDEEKEPASPGFYENIAYGYSFSYPEHWPIKIRSEENMSVGTMPPKNGQGAITVEVAEDLDDEIEEAKAEAQRYTGIISIEENPIIIDGISGTKMTLYNSMNDLTDVYIYLERGGYYYVIKYSEESPSFLADVEESLSTFKFAR